MRNTSTEAFNSNLADHIYKALKPGGTWEVGFDEIAGTLGDFTVAAVKRGLGIYATTANSVTLRKSSVAEEQAEKSAKDVIMSYYELQAIKQENDDLNEQNATLMQQLASLRRQLKSYQDATNALMALINANNEE